MESATDILLRKSNICLRAFRLSTTFPSPLCRHSLVISINSDKSRLQSSRNPSFRSLCTLASLSHGLIRTHTALHAALASPDRKTCNFEMASHWSRRFGTLSVDAHIVTMVWRSSGSAVQGRASDDHQSCISSNTVAPRP